VPAWPPVLDPLDHCEYVPLSGSALFLTDAEPEALTVGGKCKVLISETKGEGVNLLYAWRRKTSSVLSLTGGSKYFELW
jgi:hypothetical protein